MKRIFETNDLEPVSFYQALEYFKHGVLIECHIEDKDGIVIEWEKYHN